MRDKPIPPELISEWLKYAPMLTCNIVIEEEERVLLVKRKNDPEKGKWFTPGGILTKKFQYAFQDARDIVLDETGLLVMIESTPSDMYEEEHDVGYGTTDIKLMSLIFYANTLEAHPIPKTNDDHSDIKWFKVEKNPPFKIIHDESDEMGKYVQDIIYFGLIDK